MSEEVHPRADELDALSALELARVMHEEDGRAVAAVRASLGDVARAAELIAERLAAGGRLHYFGAGTSGMVARTDASECPATFGVAADVVQAHAADAAAEEDDVELGRRAVAAASVTARDAVVGITASGRTAFVTAALDAAPAGALRVAVTCNPGSPLGRAADVAIEVETGAEVIAGSTRLKAGTVQKLVLNMLSTIAFTRLGRTYRGRMVAVVAGNRKLRERAARIVADLTGMPLDEARRRLEESGGDVRAVLAGARSA
jgi:N-acetylmuramic acid 6-phosphate etherase